jgi:hypothetical protein
VADGLADMVEGVIKLSGQHFVCIFIVDVLSFDCCG